MYKVNWNHEAQKYKKYFTSHYTSRVCALRKKKWSKWILKFFCATLLQFTFRLQINIVIYMWCGPSLDFTLFTPLHDLMILFAMKFLKRKIIKDLYIEQQAGAVSGFNE